MTRSSILATTCAYAAVALAAAVGYALLLHMYGTTLLLLIGIIGAMETRVRLGYTLPRGPLFFIHVTSGALLFSYLLALYGMDAPGQLGLLFSLYALMIVSGGIMLYRTLVAFDWVKKEKAPQVAGLTEQ